MRREANIPTQADLDYLKETPSAYVRDAVNRLHIGGCVMNGPVPVRPFGFGNRHVAGPVRTVQLLPIRGTGLRTYNIYSEVIPFSEPGEVLVIAGNGLPGWAAGENLINHSIQYGLTAWVTDLRMRDVGEIREMGFPVICNGATPETFDQEIVGMNVPVYVAGAQVRGGDIIVADDDGAVVIPIEAFNQVMVNVRDMAEKETEQERLIKSKAPLDELLAFLATKGRAL